MYATFLPFLSSPYNGHWHHVQEKEKIGITGVTIMPWNHDDDHLKGKAAKALVIPFLLIRRPKPVYLQYDKQSHACREAPHEPLAELLMIKLRMHWTDVHHSKLPAKTQRRRRGDYIRRSECPLVYTDVDIHFSRRALVPRHAAS